MKFIGISAFLMSVSLHAINRLAPHEPGVNEFPSSGIILLFGATVAILMYLGYYWLVSDYFKNEKKKKKGKPFTLYDWFKFEFFFGGK